MLSRHRVAPSLIASLFLLCAGVALSACSSDRDAPQNPEPEAQAAFTPAKADPVEVAPELEPEPEPAPQDVLPVEELSADALELAYKIDELHHDQLGQRGRRAKKDKTRTLHPARVIFVTNFDKADITINGLVYPEYYEDDEEEGILLPAGGPYDVRVTYSGNTKDYTLSLKPYEKRFLVVELSGYKGGTGEPAPARPTPAVTPPPAEAKVATKEEEESTGRVTVYSKPRGDIMVDGKEAGKRTPNTVEVDEGRHEVQVRYESGEISEKKIVRARKGSRIKLFFREPK